MSRKLEIGPGAKPIAGFESINIEPNGFSEHVADASGKLPFDDNTFEIIYASHVLEHIPWYMLEIAVSEWIRVLQPGGRLEIWVPDALKIASALVHSEVTGIDATAQDGWYRFNPDKDPCVWAAGRLMTYGDGTGKTDHWNWHRAIFTPRYLLQLLRSSGLEDVRRLDIKEVRGYNHGWINLGGCGSKPLTGWKAQARKFHLAAPLSPVGAPSTLPARQLVTPSDRVEKLDNPLVPRVAPQPKEVMDLGELWKGQSWHEISSTARKTINYRSYEDLYSLIRRRISYIASADMIVGVPRSGMVPANMIGLLLNVPVITVDAFAEGKYEQPLTKRVGLKHDGIHLRPLHVVVIDDSVNTGNAMRNVKKIHDASQSKNNHTLTYAAIYGTRSAQKEVDFIFEFVEQPRVFEWNLFHHTYSSEFCFDLDGVFCEDPTREENDDGKSYEKFILEAKPKIIPTRKVGAIVTSRLEKYRELTVEWLQRNRITFDQLIMLNLPTAQERRNLGIHAQFKADVYKALNGALFVESEKPQASQIAQLSGRPVYCIGDGIFYR